MFKVESVEFNLVIRGDGWWAERGERGASAECHEYSVRSCAGRQDRPTEIVRLEEDILMMSYHFSFANHAVLLLG